MRDKVKIKLNNFLLEEIISTKDQALIADLAFYYDSFIQFHWLLRRLEARIGETIARIELELDQ